jgi:hypothetical protein
MKLLRCVVCLQFATSLGFGQPVPGANQPEAVVRSLYRQVIARHPTGIPHGADLNLLAPYLSKALLHKIDAAQACSVDWDRSNPDPALKAKMASADDPFSGFWYHVKPGRFKIESNQRQRDGSVIVNVKLSSLRPSERDYPWHVAVAVVQEHGRYAVDNVIYINDSSYDNPADKPPDERLSEYLSAGCNGSEWAGHSLPMQPEAFARSLYQLVVDRKPAGVPSGTDWKIFAPYLSGTLMHRMEVHLACMANWDWQQRHYHRGLAKAPGLYESGLFSGGDEEGEPRAFLIEKTQLEQDGSSRVYVKLTWGEPPERPDNWRVAAVLVHFSRRLALDDVIFLKDENHPKEARLSEILTVGCNGSHWGGYLQR